MHVVEGGKIRELIVVGDRVLIRPADFSDRTGSGLYLPATVVEKEKVRTGYVVKTGPGYALPTMEEDEEPWKPTKSPVRFLPLQAQEGDQALYLASGAQEIEYAGESYVIVPHHAILMLVRDEADLG